MKRRHLAFFIGCFLPFFSTSAQRFETKSLDVLFDRLCAFEEVEVAHVPTSVLYSDTGEKPEINLLTLRAFLREAKKNGNNFMGEMSLSERKNKESMLSIAFLSDLSSLAPEKKIFIESLFSSEHFQDAVLTMKMKEQGDAISVFVPCQGDYSSEKRDIYMLLQTQGEYYVIRLEGAYTFHANWRISPSSKEIKKDIQNKD